MPAEHTIRLDHNIYPLSFLQIYRTANPFIDALGEKDATVQEWFGRSAALKQVISASGVPLYYHLMTSGYGALIGSEMAGWMFLRGWRQVLYIDGLAVSPQFRRQGIGKNLMQFAEIQARELHREWLGLTVTVANTPAVSLYEQMGYQRGHNRILCTDQALSPLSTSGFSLQSLLVPAANTEFQHFAMRDLQDSDPDLAAIESRFLGRESYHSGLGKHWLVIVDQKPSAYLNLHTRNKKSILYIAANRDVWGGTPIVAAMRSILERIPGQAQKQIEVRAASSEHHDVLREALAPFGFTEAPALTMKMYKHIV